MVHRAELLARLRLARKHVVDGQICLARQREIIARLMQYGFPTSQAQRVLHEMKITHEMRLDSALRHFSELEYRELVAEARSVLESQLV